MLDEPTIGVNRFPLSRQLGEVVRIHPGLVVARQHVVPTRGRRMGVFRGYLRASHTVKPKVGVAPSFKVCSAGPIPQVAVLVSYRQPPPNDERIISKLDRALLTGLPRSGSGR